MTFARINYFWLLVIWIQIISMFLRFTVWTLLSVCFSLRFLVSSRLLFLSATRHNWCKIIVCGSSWRFVIGCRVFTGSGIRWFYSHLIFLIFLQYYTFVWDSKIRIRRNFCNTKLISRYGKIGWNHHKFITVLNKFGRFYYIIIAKGKVSWSVP